MSSRAQSIILCEDAECKSCFKKGTFLFWFCALNFVFIPTERKIQGQMMLKKAHASFLFPILVTFIYTLSCCTAVNYDFSWYPRGKPQAKSHTVKGKEYKWLTHGDKCSYKGDNDKSYYAAKGHCRQSAKLCCLSGKCVCIGRSDQLQWDPKVQYVSWHKEDQGQIVKGKCASKKGIYCSDENGKPGCCVPCHSSLKCVYTKDYGDGRKDGKCQ